METVLYFIWISIPTCLFLIALYGALEARQRKSRRSDSGDLVRQGLFVSVCVATSMLIDKFLLDGVINFVSPDLIPRGLAQIMLLPFVLIVGSRIYGPSKDLKITKAPDLSRQAKR